MITDTNSKPGPVRGSGLIPMPATSAPSSPPSSTVNHLSESIPRFDKNSKVNPVVSYFLKILSGEANIWWSFRKLIIENKILMCFRYSLFQLIVSTTMIKQRCICNATSSLREELLLMSWIKSDENSSECVFYH